MANIKHQIITCFIIDDELSSIDILENYILRTEGLTLIGKFTNPIQALAKMHLLPQIIFLDVDMPEMSGLDFAVATKSDTNIIFITSFPSVPMKAFPNAPFEYLPKPISYSKFENCVRQIIKKITI